MCKYALHQFLADHHLHLEGWDDPSYESPESLSKRCEHFNNLDDFLQCHYCAVRVLVIQDDFKMLAWEYFVTAHADGVRHAEVFFDPQSHTSRGVPFDTVVTGFKAGCVRAERHLGVTSRLIMCFLCHLLVSSAAETLQSAIVVGHLDGDDDSRAICGFSLDSSEIGLHPELFTDMYLEGEKRGVRRAAHGGEEGDPTYVSAALDSLHAERIDHGVRLVGDAELLRRVIDEKILLTVCPLRNVCLHVITDVTRLSIKRFPDEGIRFSINSDDPTYFVGYILNNYCAVQEAFGFSVGRGASSPRTRSKAAGLERNACRSSCRRWHKWWKSISISNKSRRFQDVS